MEGEGSMYRKVYKICEIINKAYEALALLLLVAMTIALSLIHS